MTLALARLDRRPEGSGSSVLNFNAFATCMTQLVNPMIYGRLDIELRREHLKLLAQIFDAVCMPRSDLATVRDCGIALCMFSGGNVAEKTSTAFWCFDQHNDGYIRIDEMEHYLKITFTVVFALTENQTPYVVEDLARLTAIQCFEEADLNHDGCVSWEEFVNWFSASGLM